MKAVERKREREGRRDGWGACNDRKGAFVGTVSCVQRIAPNGARTRGPTCSLSAVRVVALSLFDVSRVFDCCSCDERSGGNDIEGVAGCAGRAVAGGDGGASLRGEDCAAGEGARRGCEWSVIGVLGIERLRGCMGRAESMMVDAVADDEEGMRSDGEGGEIWLLAREEGSRLWRASLGSPSQILGPEILPTRAPSSSHRAPRSVRPNLRHIRAKIHP